MEKVAGKRQLYQAAQNPKEEWIAPSGGHTGALNAHQNEYERRVMSFFVKYL